MPTVLSGSELVLHSGGALRGRGWTMWEPSGRQQGPGGVYTCVQAPPTLHTRKQPQLLGKRAGEAGGPGDPDRARIQSRSAHLGSEVDGNDPQQREWIQEICLMDGTSMGGVRGLWDHPGLPVGSNLETSGFERNLSGGNVGTPHFTDSSHFRSGAHALIWDHGEQTEATPLQGGLEQKVGLSRNASCCELRKTEMCREGTSAELLRTVPPRPIEPTFSTGQALHLHQGAQQTAAKWRCQKQHPNSLWC